MIVEKHTYARIAENLVVGHCDNLRRRAGLPVWPVDARGPIRACRPGGPVCTLLIARHTFASFTTGSSLAGRAASSAGPRTAVGLDETGQERLIVRDHYRNVTALPAGPTGPTVAAGPSCAPRPGRTPVCSFCPTRAVSSSHTATTRATHRLDNEPIGMGHITSIRENVEWRCLTDLHTRHEKLFVER